MHKNACVNILPRVEYLLRERDHDTGMDVLLLPSGSISGRKTTQYFIYPKLFMIDRGGNIATVPTVTCILGLAF